MRELPLEAEVTVATPWGEKTERAEHCLWDTGATDVSMNKAFADRMGIMAIPPMDDELQPLMTIDANYVGFVSARLRIGDVATPYLTVKVTDYDPKGKFAEMGYQLPDMIIGMSVIGLGRFEVDSTGDQTVVRFELPKLL